VFDLKSVLGAVVGVGFDGIEVATGLVVLDGLVVLAV